MSDAWKRVEGRGCCLSMLYRFYDASLQVMDAVTFFEKSIIGGAWGWVIWAYARAKGFLREACFGGVAGVGEILLGSGVRGLCPRLASEAYLQYSLECGHRKREMVSGTSLSATSGIGR